MTNYRYPIPVTKYRRYYTEQKTVFSHKPRVTGYLLEGNKYTGYHRQGFEIPNYLPE
jgi:hypothetical protein